MEMETLVQKITDEVMKQLQIKECKETEYFSKQALILSSADSFGKEKIVYLKTNGINCLFVDGIAKDELGEIDCIIVPSLPVTSLAYIALGIEGDEISKKVVRGMLSGKEILVLNEGLEHKKFESICNQQFYNLYRKYEGMLKDFGVQFKFFEEIVCSSLKDSLRNKSSEAKEEIGEKIILNNKVITEEALKKLDFQSSNLLYITSKAIVTPMAKDYVRSNKIRLVVME